MSKRNTLFRKKQRALARKIKAMASHADSFITWTKGVNKYGNLIYIPKKVSYEEFIGNHSSL